MVPRHHHLGNWRSFLHVASIYAPEDDARAANAALFAAIVELAAIGEVPILLAGDFNLEPQNSPKLHAACTNGGWHDIADLFARQNGAPVASSCTARPGAHPRRIDYMLANTVMFGACTEFSVLENTGLPTHKPLSVLLSLDALERRPPSTHATSAAPATPPKSSAAATADDDHDESMDPDDAASRKREHPTGSPPGAGKKPGRLPK